MTENIRVLTHSSIRIQSGDTVLYVDPYKVSGRPQDADYVFITHDHFDHFSPEDIEKVSCDKTVLVVPEKMRDKVLQEADETRGIIPVKPDSPYDINGFSFETVPAYNRLKPFHPKTAGWVGYIFCLDGKRIYVAGDTDATPDAKKVRCDVALVPVGGTYTMNASQAAELVNTIRPAAAIPTHYGSVAGSAADAESFREKVDPAVHVEIKMES
ncbi:MAG: MBL fold metallo-hydrolase [Oscillospiraceae bacterium]|jgi:L-ascorbate metabolism protein UlaG (beta-lactamase superfamily)|nr:MBL fold metallo-hydrolase [Oscillospiraceae bacterium]